MGKIVDLKYSFYGKITFKQSDVLWNAVWRCVLVFINPKIYPGCYNPSSLSDVSTDICPIDVAVWPRRHYTGWEIPDHWAFSVGQVEQNGWLVYAPPCSLPIGEERVRGREERRERAESSSSCPSAQSPLIPPVKVTYTWTQTHTGLRCDCNWEEYSVFVLDFYLSAG